MYEAVALSNLIYTTHNTVFPWVLRDFKSERLDLSNATVFRDLSKPMGAQDPSRARYDVYWLY
jgi:hypothetical protein